MSSPRSGFTVVELMVAIFVLVIGLLALLGSSALDQRSVTRERNIDIGAIYAARRLELLRVSACRNPSGASEALIRGADTVVLNTWAFTSTLDAGGNIDGYRMSLVSRYFKLPVRRYGDTRAYSAITTRTDTFEAAISCAP